MSRLRTLTRPGTGFTLIELCLATAMGALLLTALAHVARLATESKLDMSDANEQNVTTDFVMQRLRLAAQGAIVGDLQADGSGDTGLWLDPKRFCINSSKALVETDTSDTNCSQGEVIADRASRLTISMPSTQSGVDAPNALLTVVLTLSDGTEGPALTQTIRLKGLLE